MFKNEIAPPESVQRAKQISIEKEEQDQVDRNAKNTGKLHGKALPGFSLFAQCHGETQTKTENKAVDPMIMATIQPRIPRKPS